MDANCDRCILFKKGCIYHYQSKYLLATLAADLKINLREGQEKFSDIEDFTPLSHWEITNLMHSIATSSFHPDYAYVAPELYRQYKVIVDKYQIHRIFDI
jgi:hypothetical protein